MLSAKDFEDIRCQAFLGLPTRMGNICTLYPLTVKEVVAMGISNFYDRLGLLVMTEQSIIDIIKKKTKEDISDKKIDPLMYLLQSTEVNDSFLLELRNAFFTFIKEDVLFLPELNSVVVGNPKDKRLITTENFKDFQNILRLQYRQDVIEPPPENETPGQRKMRLNREKVAEVKRKQAQKNVETQSFDQLLENAAVYGVDVNTCSYYAFYGLLHKHQRKEQWDQENAFLCAGAKSDKLLKNYWGEKASI